jgi:hypothetical protein
MNVLILTPDRVGSTLLQRLLTVYANINETQTPPTVNLHELTNGLVEYQHPQYGTMLGKKESGWGYHQSLHQISTMIDHAPHDIVSRLAHYHIKNRKDSQAEQLDFYRYLNENFYIVAARRKNLFEHAMSWCIASESKKLNAYTIEEKHQTFEKINRTGIHIQEESIEKYLNQYNEYLDWVDCHFNVNSYFEYERDLPNIENYILNLSVFRDFDTVKNWEDKFMISWADWNRMHYLLSLVPFDYLFSQEEQAFMQQHIELYKQARIHLQDLQDAGILVSGIPIKLHTLREKAQLITNTPQVLEYYNNWIGVNRPSYALSYQPETLTQMALLEHNVWSDSNPNRSLLGNSIPPALLLESDLKFT